MVCRLRPRRAVLSPTTRREASTSANPYPYPKNAHPTPHQIFHLPKTATRADVKARYYDLVRIYHPDSPSARAGGISPETAHARFQSIASAYAILSGKKPASSLDGSDAGEGATATARATYHDLSTAMWRARQMKRAELDVGLDERWKERLMLGAVLVTISLFVYQTYTTRSQALSESRSARRTISRSESSASLDSDEVRRLSLETRPPPETTS
ncbi:hypothetical protein C8Q77DRAFT_1057390 [Trametes polyzona]|nr:hypothetical protein C8Q77DRAFT_1057390 [Trametes polyzona]